MIQGTIISHDEIACVIKSIDVVPVMEEGFVEYSNGNVVVPPVAELLFQEPKGEAHIKYGYIKGDDFYCIKIASGFYGNSALGISSSQGLMLLFNQKTGELVAVLLDGGFLTDIRTAAAGALVATYFAPQKIEAIGIIGSGIQGRLQLRYLQNYTACRNVWVWSRNADSAQKFNDELGAEFDITIASSPAQVAANCNLIVTATASTEPLLMADDVRPGTHITAVGSDTAEKQELHGGVLAKADLVISDSIPQSKTRGEVFRAIQDGLLQQDQVVELGNAIQHATVERPSEDAITVADLTGVAIQDIMIAKAVYLAYID